MTSTSPISHSTGGTGHTVIRRCAIIFLLALLIRGGGGVFRYVQAGDAATLEFPDEQQYWSTSRGLRAGVGLRDELGFRVTRMPLFPAILAMFPDGPGGLMAARSCQWVFSAAAAAFVSGLASVWFDRRVSWLAGLFVVFDPFLVFSSNLLLTESLALAVSVALWWVLARWLRNGNGPAGYGVGVGALAALCVYARESSLGLVAVALCFVVFHQRFSRSALTGAAVTAMLLAASLVPWAVRNERITGSRVWLTTRAGISLYDGVKPGATGASDLGDIKNMPAVHGMSETQWNRYFLDASKAAIADDPARILSLGGTKFLRMWNPFPNVDAYQSVVARVVSAGWAIPTLALAVVGVFVLPVDRGREGFFVAMFLLLPAAYLTALHCVFVGSIRYRLGAVPMLHVLAAVGLMAAWDRWRTGSSAGERSHDG